ncbi:hypothetical protein [Mucilaginibacter pedocola]|uniref:Uncharacterized protein n=1 Tax=Mucilaginibacter pedocola TaxID=1792845 RepID=A0A1S9PHH0_9SPHI|nr:hypothetical protein [Mucilaginibacter pedocola]OOQ60008.1 hypothetical protein BC343_27140 [Mucilaginibacter pedocola]
MRNAFPGNFVATKRNKMNHLFNHISWSAYLGTLALLLIAYYAFIGWKYYRADILALAHKLTGHKDDSRSLPAALRYSGEAPPENSESVSTSIPEETIPQPQSLSIEAQELSQILIACIKKAAGQPYAPDKLASQLKTILEGLDALPASEQQNITALIITECEKTGTALLSESEVGKWWSA